MTQTPNPGSTPLQLSAGILRVWPIERDAQWDSALERIHSAMESIPGVFQVAPDTYAAVPVDGDPAVIDACTACGRLFLRELARRGEGAASKVRLLGLSGWVRLEGDSAQLVQDPLTEDLNRHPPELEPGVIHLTSGAALTLETPWEVHPVAAYRSPSGRTVPLLRVGEREVLLAPWRNREIWGRELTWVARPRLRQAFADVGRPSLLRIAGPLGCGKTRAVASFLASSGTPTAHTAVGGPRSDLQPLGLRILERALTALPTTAAQPRAEVLRFLQREAENRRRNPGRATSPTSVVAILTRAASTLIEAGLPPLAIVCDDLQGASGEDWALIGQLAGAISPRGPFRLLLVGRTSTHWPDPFLSVAQLEVAEMKPEEAHAHAGMLLKGLPLPREVRDRLIEAGARNPLFFEEGFVGLIERRLIRRHVGALVFTGDEGTDFSPSRRLLRHLEAEAQRQGCPMPLRILAVAQEPVPARHLQAAAAVTDGLERAGWDEPFRATGWLRDADSPWGPALCFSAEALRITLERTIPDDARRPLRQVLGELLSAQGDGEALWRSYRLLAKSESAVPVLLRAVDAGNHGASDREVVEALLSELWLARERHLLPDLELELLWRLLPLARRTRQLGRLEEEVDRALSLTATEPKRLLAFSALKVQLDQQEGRFSDAERTLREVLRRSKVLDDGQKALLLVQLGRVLMRQNRHDEAIELFQQLLPTLEKGGLKALEASCHFHLGNIALSNHDYEAALENHEKALEQRRQLKALKPLSASLTALGAVSRGLGRYTQALSYYREAKEVAEKSGDPIELAYASLGVGGTLRLLGDFAAAAAPLRQSLALREDGDDLVGEAIARLAVAQNLLDLDKAREALEEARRALFRLSLQEGMGPVGDAERVLGLIHLRQRRPNDAWDALQGALRKHQRNGDELGAALDRAWLLRAALDGRRPEELADLALALHDYLERFPYPEEGEWLDYSLFRATESMRAPVAGLHEPQTYLRRAYDSLLRKTAFLEPALRNRFLFQIPANRAILDDAARCEITHV